MRHVTFSKPMAPFAAGEKRLVPDDVAARLDKEGVLESSEPWPPKSPAKPLRPVITTQRPVVEPKRPGAQLELGVSE